MPGRAEGVQATARRWACERELVLSRNVVVLRCPACGTESRTAERPFEVLRPPGVDYTYAECSNCGAPIYLDRYADWV